MNALERSSIAGLAIFLSAVLPPSHAFAAKQQDPVEKANALIEDALAQNRQEKLNFLLAKALEDGDMTLVGALINKGANAKAIEPSKLIGKAACDGHTDAVSWLIDNGADPISTVYESCNLTGYATPLEYACVMGHADTANLILDRAIPKGLNLQDPSYNFIIYAAAKGGSHQGAEEPMAGVLKRLIQLGALTQERAIVGLRNAAWSGNPSGVKILLENGAPIDTDCGDTEVDAHKTLFHGVQYIRNNRHKTLIQCVQEFSEFDKNDPDKQRSFDEVIQLLTKKG